MLDYLSSSAFEKRNDLFYVLIILLLRDASDAASFTLLDMEVQTRADLATQNDIRSYLVLARAKRIYRMNELYQISSM
jgi:hypothetical protein